MFPRRPFLDFFTRTHWVVVPIVYLPLIALFAWHASARESPAALAVEFAAGIGTWTLLEYVLHRTVFHLQLPGEFGRLFHFYVHGVHHENRNDRFRLVMPPAASLGLGAVIYAGLTACNAWLRYMFAALVILPWVDGFFSGLMAGYLMYDMMHYYIHHGESQGHLFPNLRQHHLRHHGKSDRRYGVSTPFWDWVFDTN